MNLKWNDEETKKQKKKKQWESCHAGKSPGERGSRANESIIAMEWSNWGDGNGDDVAIFEALQDHPKKMWSILIKKYFLPCCMHHPLPHPLWRVERVNVNKTSVNPSFGPAIIDAVAGLDKWRVKPTMNALFFTLIRMHYGGTYSGVKKSSGWMREIFWLKLPPGCCVGAVSDDVDVW